MGRLGVIPLHCSDRCIGKVRWNTDECTTTFLHSDWLYFLWHGINTVISHTVLLTLLFSLTLRCVNQSPSHFSLIYQRPDSKERTVVMTYVSLFLLQMIYWPNTMLGELQIIPSVDNTVFFDWSSLWWQSVYSYEFFRTSFESVKTKRMSIQYRK